MPLRSFLGSASVVFLLFGWLLITPTFSQTIDQDEAAFDTLSRYEDYSRLFYEDESIELSFQLIPLEKHLTFLIQSVNSQFKKRKDLYSLDISSLSTEEISQLAMVLSQTDKGNYYAGKFEIWKRYQFNEIFLKIDRTLRLKRRIWEMSSPIERESMFEEDFKYALEMFEIRDYNNAIRAFNHIIEFYGYANIDDVLFYRSEAHYSLNQHVAAEEGYEKIISEFPESKFFEPALYRRISLNYTRGNFKTVHELYSIFEGNVDISWDYKKDVIFFIEASTLFLQGYYDRAYDIFSRISEDSDYYGLTQYLSVHCMLRLDNIDSAIITFSSILSGEIQVEPAVRDETAVLMGDIRISQEEHNLAWGYYQLVGDNSSHFPHALVGKVMVRFIRGEYDMAVVLVDSLIDHHGSSNYIYQARCLKGACQRRLGDLDLATEQYSIVLNESEKKINLVNYLTEKLKIIYLVNEWRRGEQSVLATGDEELFERYWLLRTNAENLLKRVYYTEIIEVEPEFAEYIKEKLNIIKLIDEFKLLSEDVKRVQHAKTDRHFTQLQTELLDLNNMVQASGYGKLKKLPYYYTNVEAKFSSEAIDSLYKATSKEISEIEDQLIAMSKALAVADEEIEPEKRAKMLEVAHGVRQWRTNLDERISGNIRRLQPLPELDLTRWSHVAFHKTMIPGSDFNDLKAEQKRVKDIEAFLQAMDNIALQLGFKLQQ